jgi:hypothetical protein
LLMLIRTCKTIEKIYGLFEKEFQTMPQMIDFHGPASPHS